MPADPAPTELLMIPGPTNVPASALAALGRPPIYHRGEEFARLLASCTEGLQRVFQTRNDVLILTASGTGAVEAAIVNSLSPGDRVVAVRSGKFGERLAEIAAIFGAEVTSVDVEAGKAVEPEQVRAALLRSGAKALLFIQNETSTGVCQDVAAIAAVAREQGALVVVDAVSGMGGIPVQTDGWGLDLVASGSQKAFMLPPGLGFVSVSEAGWEAAKRARMPRLYFDLPAARASLAKGQTPFTPNVNMLMALEAVLEVMFAEGMEAVYARHASLARACRAGMEALGLSLFADPRHASDIVTAVAAPPEIDIKALTKAVRSRHRIVITGGQGELQGKILRVAHVGMCTMEDLLRTIRAIAEELAALGHPCSAEAAALAAMGAG
jgi:aspartate aminotransferase-like enzyme